MRETQTPSLGAGREADSGPATVKLGFELEGQRLPLSALLPSHPVSPQVLRSDKYRAVHASIQEVGVVEPLVVHVLPGRGPRRYLLLDGHLRLEVLKELGETEALCLLATDDEAYTYNHKVNRLRPIHEHFMIMRALQRGVSEERIARALHVDVQQIRLKRDMLRGICPEAVALAKETAISAASLRHLRAVVPARQVEILELMLLVGNLTGPYCQALVAATPPEQRLTRPRPGTRAAISARDLTRIEREVEALQRDLQAHEESYGSSFLQLVAVRGYLAKLLGNEAVGGFLATRYGEFTEGLGQIVASTSLEG